MRTCYVDGCERPHSAKDFCNMHYMRWLHHGHTGTVDRIDPIEDGSTALLERMEGLASYRQIDYWIRSGAVDLPHLRDLGSGRRRRFTEVEQLAIIALAEELREIEERDLAVRDGSFFRRTLAALSNEMEPAS